MNMLRNIKFYLSALAVLVLATSCLDKYPESAIPEKDLGDGRMYRCLLGQDELKEVYSHE